MVQVMRASGSEIVAAVHAGRLDQLGRQEEREGQDVRAHEHHGQHDGERVGQQVLDRVRVLGRERHRRRELVVLLVDARVDARVVQRAVGRVEEHLAQKQRDSVVRRDLDQRRQLRCGGEEGELEVLEVEHGEVDGLGGQRRD